MLGFLLARSASGDEGAFTQLYEVAAPRLFGLVRSVLCDYAQAEEVTQEVFLIVWSTCGSFDPTRGSAMGWMCSIAHRRAVDRVRTTEANKRRDAAWALRHLDATHDSTAEAAHASIEATRVRAALRGLSPRQRTAISLAYYAGQTHTQVAAALRIPQSTSKSRLRDGLRTLSVSLGTEATLG